MPAEGTIENLVVLRNAVLLCAADLIEQRGWSPRGTRPQLCITQALAEVTGHDDHTAPDSIPEQVSYAAMSAVLELIGGQYITDIFAWECRDSRTQAKVTALLRAAAETTERERRPALCGRTEGASGRQ